MAQEETYNIRDRSYSAWHRRSSTGRFVGVEKAQLLAMIDLDATLYVEYDDGTKDPLALIETAKDVGQDWKPATVTRNLARKAGIPGYALLYTLSNVLNPADQAHYDISLFRVRRLWPEPETNWYKFTPKQWATVLLALRQRETNKLDELAGYATAI